MIIKEGYWRGEYKSISVENSLIKVTVLPHYDGRVIEYKLKSSGHNQLFSDTHDEDVAGCAGLMYHLLTGSISNSEEPALKMLYPHYLTEYKSHKIVKQKDSVKILCCLAGKEAVHEITYIFFENSTRLRIEVKVTNKSRESISFQHKIHPTWTVGGEIGASQIITIPIAGKIMRYPYSRANCQEIFIPSENWAAVSNYSKKESVLMFGDNNLAMYFIYSDDRVFTLEPCSKIKSLGRNESLVLSMDYYLLRGLGTVDYVKGDLVMGFSPEKQFFLQPEPIKIIASLGFLKHCFSKKDLEVNIALRHQNKILKETKIVLSLKECGPFEGIARTVSYGSKGLRDGTYEVDVKARIDGSSCDTEMQIELIKEALDGYYKRWSLLRNKVNRIQKILKDELESQCAKVKLNIRLSRIRHFIGLWTRMAVAGNLFGEGFGKKKESKLSWNRPEIESVEKQLNEAEERLRILLGKRKYAPEFPLAGLTSDFRAPLVWESDYRRPDSRKDFFGIYCGAIPLVPDTNIRRRITTGKAITGEDIEKLCRKIDSPVKAKGICDILSFDYSSAVVVYTDRCYKRIACYLAEKLGLEVKHLIVKNNTNKNLLIVGNKSEIELRFGKNRFFTNEKKNAVLEIINNNGSKAILIGGCSEEKIKEAAGMLVCLLEVLRKNQPWVGDLHMHSTYSDGKLPPLFSVLGAIRNHLDFFSLTDFMTLEGSKEAGHIVRKMGLELTVINGQETAYYKSKETHFNIINYNRPIKSWKEKLAGQVHRKGGIVILTHAAGNANALLTPEWEREMLENWEKTKIDAFDVVGAGFDYFYKQWERKGELPALIGSTDTHISCYAVPVRTVIFSPRCTPHDIVVAIKNKQCAGYKNGKFYGPPSLVKLLNMLLQERDFLEELYRKRLLKRFERVLLRIA